MTATYSKYDLVGAKVRAMLIKLKYGSAVPAQLIQLLRSEADRIEREYQTEINRLKQERFDVT